MRKHGQGGRKRVSGYTLEQRLWYWLRKHPGAKMRDAMAHFDIDRWAAGQTICRLVDKGSATRSGKARASRYTATDLRPDDLRGTSAESLAPLFAKIEERQRARKPRRIQRRHDSIALARAWPLLAEVRT